MKIPGNSVRRTRVLLASAIAMATTSSLPATAANLGDRQAEDAQGARPTFLLQDTRPATDAAANTTDSATAPAAQPLRVIVRELRGMVSASTDEGKTWKRVAAGDAFGPGAMFRTGLKSAVTCTVGTDQMFTLESLSTIRVEEALRTGGREKTDLLMKYGAASYGIERAGREYDATIRTPGSTMSIGGTVVRVYDRPGFAAQAESYTGRALFRTAKGATLLGGGGRGYSVANAVQGSAAETALANSTVDPSIAAARTAAETTVISQQLSQGGVLGFDQRANIAVVRGGGPLPDSALPGSLPGRLNFALRWGGSADLNFIVDNQAGNQDNIILSGFRPSEILFPGYGLNVSTSGGIIPYDHRGGPTGGTEIAYWRDTFPSGVYGVGVLHASGRETDFKINAFLDKQPLPIFAFDEEGNIARFTTFQGTVGPDGGDGAILFVPRNPTFEDLAGPGDTDQQTTEAIGRALRAIRAKGAEDAKRPSLPALAAKAAPAQSPAAQQGVAMKLGTAAKQAKAKPVGPTARPR